MVTIATVGYGDFSPQTVAGRVLSTILILISTLFIFVFISMLFEYYTAVRLTRTLERKKSKARRAKFIEDAATMRQSMVRREQLKFDDVVLKKPPQWIFHVVIFFAWVLGWALFFTFSVTAGYSFGRSPIASRTVLFLRPLKLFRMVS